MIIKIKKLYPNAVIPSYSKQGDIGLDLTSISKMVSEDNLYVEYGTGLSIELPDNFGGLIFK